MLQKGLEKSTSLLRELLVCSKNACGLDNFTDPLVHSNIKSNRPSHIFSIYIAGCKDHFDLQGFTIIIMCYHHIFHLLFISVNIKVLGTGVASFVTYV